jgi:predicted nucleic acid-binding protein
LTGWFLDASVLLARADPDDDEHQAATAVLGGATALATLDLAYYEVVIVALGAWSDPALAGDLRRAVAAIERDGGLLRMDEPLAAATTEHAASHGLSAYDGAYVVAAEQAGMQLLSCDVRDLVRPGFALTPAQALRG